MRAACADLTHVSLEGAHWLPLERKTELSGAMADWIAVKQL